MAKPFTFLPFGECTAGHGKLRKAVRKLDPHNPRDRERLTELVQEQRATCAQR